MKAAPFKVNFNGGEISEIVAGRIDTEKYQASCHTLENFIPTIQGAIIRRGGTRFVSEIKTSADRTWLIPFEFNIYESYMLEFGDKYIRFYSNRGVVESAPSVPYEIVSPYNIADLTNTDGTFALRYVQSADVIYIVHPKYPPYKLSRFAHTNWAITLLDSSCVVFKDIDYDNTVTLTPSAYTGTITLTASASTFSAASVGRKIYIESKAITSITEWEVGVAITSGNYRRSDGKIYKALNSATTGTVRPSHTRGAFYDGSAGVQWEFISGNSGWVTITAYTNATTVTATVNSTLPQDSSATTVWAFDDWNSTDGYPEYVTFFSGRLVFSRNQTVWMGVVNDFENFAMKNESGEITADMAIKITISSDQVNKINWLAPNRDGLIVGTSGSEFIISGVTSGEAISQSNIQAKKQSSNGSKSISPIVAENGVIYVTRSGRRIREMGYVFSSDAYKSGDITIYHPDITGAGVIDFDFQSDPYSIVWAARKDGVLLGFTYETEQNVKGWHRHIIGGNGIVECVRVIPSPNGDRDDLWLIVKRTINGSTVRYVEYMENELIAEDSFYVDCGLTYDGVPADTISGLDHLEGETVTVLVDGATIPDKVVTSGTITLPYEGSKVHIGFPYTSKIQTLRMEAGSSNGTAQGKIKRITDCVVRFLNTVGAKVGTPEKQDEVKFRTPNDLMGVAIPPFSGDVKVNIPDTYNTDGYLVVKQENALPMTVAGIYPIVGVAD